MTSIYPSSTGSSNNRSTSSANLLRISGMASGIDTDSVVKSMTANIQAKIDKANQAKQTLQWKQEAYKDIISGIKGLQDYFDPLSSKYMLTGKSLNINSVASDNSAIVSATTDSNAKVGSYKVHVSQLAEQAKIEGDAKDSVINVTDLSTWNGGKLDFGSNGSITLSSISDTTMNSTNMSKLAADINKQIAGSSSLNGKISASYVSDGTNNYIKFIKADSGADSITLNKSNSTVSDIKNDLKINGGISSSSLLTDLGFQQPGNINFKLTNGTTDYNVSLTISSSTTVQNLIDQVNSATSGNVTMNVDDNTGKIAFQSKGYGSVSNIKITDTSSSNNVMTNLGIKTAGIEGASNAGKTSSSLLTDLGFQTGNINFALTNGTTNYNVALTVDGSTTVQNLIDQVNSTTSGSVKMSIDATTGKVSFSGTSTNISIKDTSATNKVVTTLGISTISSDTTLSGKDAIVDITGPGQTKATTTTQSSNRFAVNGVNYNLVGVNDAGENSNVTVTANSDNVVSNMKKFIDDYNTIITTINTKLTEKKDSSYAPLTDDQKSSMTDSQITAWEKKAKVGILKNDDYLTNLMGELRGIFSSPVYNTYDSDNPVDGKVALSIGYYTSNSIGIDTSKDYTDGGKLVLQDESKLRSVIENNSEDLKKLFIGTSSSTLGTNEAYVGSKKYNEDGLFTRMDTMLRDYVAAPGLGKDGTYTLSGSMNIFVNKQYDFSITGFSGKNTLPDQVYGQTINITKYTTQLKDAQTRYYAKFTALETAMSKLNAQQSQLSSMLGS